MILIVDDDKAVRLSLSVSLRHSGYEIVAVEGPDEALAAVRAQCPELVIMDMNFGGGTDGADGLALLQRVKVLCPGTPVILITAWGSIPLAVEGVKLGAFDFMTKPWNPRLLLQRVATALEIATPKVGGVFERSGIIGHSSALSDVLDMAARIAPTDASVLITGENGTGKEMLAREIHRLSLRSRREMINVDMGAVSESLFESELFGHEKGAFTDARESRPGKFEAASGSTLFLDEIGNLPVGLQAKLLAALQNREVTRLGSNRKIPIDIRLIAATNRDLPELVKQSLFREDLYYRINTIQIEIPPLRNRREDIPLFIDYFLKKYTALYNQPGLTIHPQAAAKLERYDWPGNIRELQHTIEKAVILAEKNVIRAADLFIRPGKSVSFSDAPNLGEVERKTIEAAITQNDGNLTAAAEQLGVSRQTLYNKLKRFNL